MRKRLLTIILTLLTICPAVCGQQLDTLALRIKGSLCDEAAHRIMICVLAIEGVDDIWFDLEKNMATVSYNPLKTTPEAIMAPIRGNRFTPSLYRPDEVILRDDVQRLELNSADDVQRALSALRQQVGIDTLSVNPTGGYLSIRYDANKTSKAQIRQRLIAAGFTPSNYYASPQFSFARFQIPALMANEETMQKALALHGVEDVCVNPDNNTLAITYYSNLSSRMELKAQLEGLGMEVK